MLRSFMSLVGAIMGEHDHDVHDDFDVHDDTFHDIPEHDVDTDYDISSLHPQVSPSFGSSSDTGTYDPVSGTATFPDGTVVTNPYQDAHGQVYKTREDWVNAQDPHTVEET
ncbi:hypothetical protein H6G89_15020 [Oscillatoria sp. FACHB-1407]|uniref:hypothetical protein n=1 Tax=Oscillatoria sp. FACHB-1407 TaxID=2692847 RepID=UPI001682F5A8|nr:hypothetical protein [Oscillatoria sp. FACHB-1407]MBD2462357.1 hypothetical protein [Oscillatoria sp. FACHB-1407]